ncbi:MAG: hypothetical protein ACRD88_15030 [Terriglobia bacterium]
MKLRPLRAGFRRNRRFRAVCTLSSRLAFVAGEYEAEIWAMENLLPKTIAAR